MRSTPTPGRPSRSTAEAKSSGTAPAEKPDAEKPVAEDKARGAGGSEAEASEEASAGANKLDQEPEPEAAAAETASADDKAEEADTSDDGDSVRAGVEADRRERGRRQGREEGRAATTARCSSARSDRVAALRGAAEILLSAARVRLWPRSHGHLPASG